MVSCRPAVNPGRGFFRTLLSRLVLSGTVRWMADWVGVVHYYLLLLFLGGRARWPTPHGEKTNGSSGGLHPSVHLSAVPCCCFCIKCCCAPMPM